LVSAANQELAVAITNQYPRLTLDAGLTTEGETSADLFDNWLRTLAGNLVGPIVDAGRRSAEADRAEAVLREQIAEYGQEVLTAFREVEDALVRERQQRRRIASLQQQVELAEQTVEQLQLEYLNGVSDYIDVLTALTEEQQLRRDLLTARRALVEFRVALYRALAGGFETPREIPRQDQPTDG
jgi:outer membrane protein TolC